MSTTEIADDMGEWLDRMGVSADTGIEISSGEEQVLSDIESMLAAGSDNGPRWIENLLGEPIESEPEYESEGSLENPSESLSENTTESGPEWLESLLGESLESELEYWSEGSSEHFSESSSGNPTMIGPEWLENLLGEPLTEPEYWPEGLSEYLSNYPAESGLNTGFQGVLYIEGSLDDISMGDAPRTPSLTFSAETDSTFGPSTADYGSLHFSFEDSDWNIAALMPPVAAFANGSGEMSPLPPPPPPPGLWDEMDGIEFELTIPAGGQPGTGPWRDEAGDPFIGTGSADEEDEGEGSEFGDGNLTNYYSRDEYGEGRLGRRSRTGSLADGSEFGEWIEGSWEDEEVILAAQLWGNQ